MSQDRDYAARMLPSIADNAAQIRSVKAAPVSLRVAYMQARSKALYEADGPGFAQAAAEARLLLQDVLDERAGAFLRANFQRSV